MGNVGLIGVNLKVKLLKLLLVESRICKFEKIKIKMNYLFFGSYVLCNYGIFLMVIYFGNSYWVFCLV